MRTRARADHTAVVAQPTQQSVMPGLVLVILAVATASTIGGRFALPLIVAAVITGAVLGNVGLAHNVTEPGLRFASKTVLRAGIVLLGLRLSVGDITELGFGTLGIIAITVTTTFFGVQIVGRKIGLSPALSLLVASGFSICGNSAIASVKGVTEAEDEEVAAAVGLVTLAGTAAIVAVPALGNLLGLTDLEMGIWVGASVQDTAQVIAVAAAAGPAVLATATAVKLTRVLFLAPIVAGISARTQRTTASRHGANQPPLVPAFVVGFLVLLLARSSGLVPDLVLDSARTAEKYALAAGMVGLGSAVRLPALRRLGFKPLALGAVAWLIVGATAYSAIVTLS